MQSNTKEKSNMNQQERLEKLKELQAELDEAINDKDEAEDIREIINDMRAILDGLEENLTEPK